MKILDAKRKEVLELEIDMRTAIALVLGTGPRQTPRFSRIVVTPDAHYFYVLSRKNCLLGWKWMLPKGVTADRLVQPDIIESLQTVTKRSVQAEFSDNGELFYRVWK